MSYRDRGEDFSLPFEPVTRTHGRATERDGVPFVYAHIRTCTGRGGNKKRKKEQVFVAVGVFIFMCRRECGGGGEKKREVKKKKKNK